MNDIFALYNSHLQSPDRYWETDHHLFKLAREPYLYEHPFIAQLPRELPGIYSVSGGRQIGKTTLLKQWIAALLASGVFASNIYFLTGELIDDHHALVKLIADFTQPPQTAIRYLVIDEITYIEDWDKGIKFVADAGYLQNCILVITGSDLSLMRAARMTFPGRRGRADRVDFHVYPLSFAESLTLKKKPVIEVITAGEDIAEAHTEELFDEFNHYLKHGGYLTALNDMARDGVINSATFSTYSDWIRGDVLKRNKQEMYLKEILIAIIKRYNKQVTWHSITDAISIDSHKTVSDYCALLADMDALFIQSALLTDKLTAAPKKARKLTFTDPFIYHALKQWLFPVAEPMQQVEQDISEPKLSSELVEAVVSNHYRRFYPTYYLKGQQEIDVAYVHDNKFWPIEIKWRNQLRMHEVKHISHYPRARVFAKLKQASNIEGIGIEPLPLALAKLDQEVQAT